MLYVSTRSNTDSFTAFYALTEELAPDGGMLVPVSLPVFSKEEIASYYRKSFGEAVSSILNLFFSADLNSWDVDFGVGRYPVRLVPMNHRMMIAEVWHNHESTYSFVERSLYGRLLGNKSTDLTPTSWARIAIRIAVLFGLYAELSQKKIYSFDVSVNSDDFSAPIAAWYAKCMGLPIGTIICTCKDNNAVWDLIHRGECNTAFFKQTQIAKPDADCSQGIERLLFGIFGYEEAERFAHVCQKHGIYKFAENAQVLRTMGFHASVVSRNRINSIVNNIYRSSDYVVDLNTAEAYVGLQDFRARTGESRMTLLFSECTPSHSLDNIAAATGIPAGEIEKRINMG